MKDQELLTDQVSGTVLFMLENHRSVRKVWSLNIYFECAGWYQQKVEEIFHYPSYQNFVNLSFLFETFTIPTEW